MSPIPIIDEKVDVVPSPVLADDSPKVQGQGSQVVVDLGPVPADDSPKVRDLVPQLEHSQGVDDSSQADHGPNVRLVNVSYYSPKATIVPTKHSTVIHDSESELDIEIRKIDAACVDADSETLHIQHLIQRWNNMFIEQGGSNSAGSSNDHRNTANNADADHDLIDRTRSPYTKQHRIEAREQAHEKPVGDSTLTVGELTRDLELLFDEGGMLLVFLDNLQ
jgi:hypothetical protein